MNSEKIDNQLKLALDSSVEQRNKTTDLNVGYDAANNTWELIVRYAESLDNVREELEISVVELLAGYAIITIPQYLQNIMKSSISALISLALGSFISLAI